VPNFIVPPRTEDPGERSRYEQKLSQRLNYWQELTATSNVKAWIQFLELSNASTAIAATITDSSRHHGLFVVKNTSSGGTESHTLTLVSGTFDGSHNVATLDAPGELLMVYFDKNGTGTIIHNEGSVGIS